MRLLLCFVASPVAYTSSCTHHARAAQASALPLAANRYGGERHGRQRRRRAAHSAPPATSTTAPTAKGQAGTVPDEASPGDAGGPGAPVPATVSRNDHDPDTTWPSADV